MGWGDELITTSFVKRAYEKTGKLVVVGNGVPIWNPMFENNPKISRVEYPNCPWVRTVKGNRHYVDWGQTNASRVVFKEDARVEPGEIFFSPHELSLFSVSDFVYIEPNIKGSYGRNKDWGFDRWQAVVDRLPHVRWIQPPGKRLRGVDQINTRTFREACALLSRALFFVGTDGGLHHAAAALGKRAVVVWGGFAPPKVLGYDFHINLHSGVRHCGSVRACDHCRRAMDAISVEMVVDAIEECLRDLSPGARETPAVVCNVGRVDVPAQQAGAVPVAS